MQVLRVIFEFGFERKTGRIPIWLSIKPLLGVMFVLEVWCVFVYSMTHFCGTLFEPVGEFNCMEDGGSMGQSIMLHRNTIACVNATMVSWILFMMVTKADPIAVWYWAAFTAVMGCYLAILMVVWMVNGKKDEQQFVDPDGTLYAYNWDHVSSDLVSFIVVAIITGVPVIFADIEYFRLQSGSESKSDHPQKDIDERQVDESKD